ncbi:hypothetical protein KKH23_02260 [Patescibacteria group bacterium]|nr:hypothetical protein [Patescibacteria group bacterium]MBU0776677.1 hypothetical protein [Patescibacteria group bacterium]MBU0846003.1 hypothetical protein [Patescibacteria group bacterium]MBU0922497.1 hypothetical protein [Patescibacteria group bacterium]MBU1066770.1 hypothetical protein [Patescibacteria group bacterium]
MSAQDERKSEKSTFKEKPEGSVGEKPRHEPEKELLSWSAPARPFKRMNREFWVTIIAMAAIVGLILFFAEGFMPVILIVSIVFLVYVMTTVEPENIGYSVTNRGIKIGEKTFEWEGLIRFWFGKRFDSQLLIVQKYGIPDRLELVINPDEKENLKTSLLKYLPEEKATPSSLDKAASWFSKKIPGI